jgi:hypothetical protein
MGENLPNLVTLVATEMSLVCQDGSKVLQKIRRHPRFLSPL